MANRVSEAAVPMFLRRKNTDEFVAPEYTESDKRVLTSIDERVDSLAPARGLDPQAYVESRMGTAAGLRAINREAGGNFYQVPPEAEHDPEAAAEAFDGEGAVIDVQTHYLAGVDEIPGRWENYRKVAPKFWKGMDDLTQYSFAEYLRCVFVEADTAVAVLSSAPYMDRYLVSNEEASGIARLIEQTAPSGRVLNHTVVDPTKPGQLDKMDEWQAQYQTAAWKIYTLGAMTGIEGMPATGTGWSGGWMLDDGSVGTRFLERVQESRCRIVCAHKGISNMVDSGSPRDIGPAAAAFPDIKFLVYHSGYEMPVRFPGEGPYTPETAEQGVNRLVSSVRAAGLKPGANVWAELGSTWFALIRRPKDAAHVLGKLLLAVGEDRILWGTDGIWYGPAQAAVDAFRAFEIPLEYQERWGYPALTSEIKEKILAHNAADVYGLDVPTVREAARNDDIAWFRDAVEEHSKRYGS